jgi:hypothetical protein
MLLKNYIYSVSRTLKIVKDNKIFLSNKQDKGIQLDWNVINQKVCKLYSFYKNKVKSSSLVIRNKFSKENIRNTFIKLEVILKIIKKSKDKQLNIPLFDLICDPFYLLIIYNNLKSKNTGGVGDIPVDDMTIFSIFSLAKELKSKKYKPKPIKRIYISKTNNKMRPLAFSSTKDNLVQAALLYVLEHIFEPSLSKVVYHSRVEKNCHNILYRLCTG